MAHGGWEPQRLRCGDRKLRGDTEGTSALPRAGWPRASSSISPGSWRRGGSRGDGAGGSCAPLRPLPLLHALSWGCARLVKPLTRMKLVFGRGREDLATPYSHQRVRVTP